ncbi:MAG: 3-(methylthio)propionyl-CoA ligase [Dongiaceae bacterium]
MRGLMMDRPLLISSLIDYAARYHGDTEIVSRTVEGETHRYGYAEAEARSKRLAQALRRLGIGDGDRVGTLAWNGFRHLELYFGVSGIGAVCHTVNPRLFRDQIRFIVNHAEDRLLFFDLTFLPLVEALAPELGSVGHYVAMTDRTHMPPSRLANLLCYEELLEGEDGDLDWPQLDESTASSLCYTSGTTGNPRGALFSHRSTVLHSFSLCMADFIAISSQESLCPVVPMFHVNGWGSAYAAAMCGARLVLPGPHLDGASLHALFEAEQVTAACGVPTIWLGLLRHLEDTGGRFSSLRRVSIGGAALPPAMIEAFEDRYGVSVIQGWGMTEMSPIGTVGTLKRSHRGLPAAQQRAIKLKQGRAMFGVELRIVDAEGRPQPHDGVATGELEVRGPWVIGAYYRDEAATRAAFDAEGWFRTGDVATIDPDGYMQIVDRRKDVIKSGGEWISSIEIENAAMGHPGVAEAAAIGVPHPRWGERPLLVIVPKPGHDPADESIRRYLAERLAKWQLPEDIVRLAEMPHTATGKILKTRLREIFRDHKLPGT